MSKMRQAGTLYMRFVERGTKWRSPYPGVGYVVHLDDGRHVLFDLTSWPPADVFDVDKLEVLEQAALRGEGRVLEPHEVRRVRHG